MKRSLLIFFICIASLSQAQTDSLFFPYTVYPKYILVLSFHSNTSHEVTAVIDSMGLVIQKAYPYCNGNWGSNDTNTFIIRRADSSDFEPGGCRELACLRKRFGYTATVGPLLGHAAYSNVNNIPGGAVYTLTQQVEVGITYGTTQAQLETEIARYGLRTEGFSYSVYLVRADAGTGTAMIDIARKLRRTSFINYVQLMVEALNCPD